MEDDAKLSGSAKGQQAVFRFAPSPNGYLHLGHAASALKNFEMARRVGGRFLLRIEDIDVGRAREDFVEAIFEDLSWLGLSWEEPVLRQSEHFADYQLAADQLNERGLIYPCFATRSQIKAAVEVSGQSLDPDGGPIYPGLHRGLDEEEIKRRKRAGEAFAMRIHMAKAVDLVRQKVGDQLSYLEKAADGSEVRVICDPMLWGDVVLQRKDVPTSYHLAVVVDDARQGITHVVRGTDLQPATSIHRLLQVMLGLPEPIYLHHELVRDERGSKLSKSDASTSLRSLRKAGQTREDILRKLRRLPGLDLN